MNHLETIEDIETQSWNALEVTHNAPDNQKPLKEVDFLVFCPHAAPEEIDGIDPKEVANTLPRGTFNGFQEFLREDPSAGEVLRYSWYRADGGAREIGAAFLKAIGERGQTGVMIGPRWIGRGVLDLNRPEEKAVGEAMFNVPHAVDRDLRGVHGMCIETLFGTAKAMMEGGSLKGVLQPHTMASGNPAEGQTDRLEVLAKGLPEFVMRDSIVYRNPALAAELLAYWREVYSAMNQGRSRSNVDVILNQHKKPETQIGDSVSARVFLQALQAQGIPAALDDPFGHVPEYPGTELSQLAVQHKVPELIFDAPRHLLLADPDAHYPLTGFRPDPSRVQIFAGTALRALSVE